MKKLIIILLITSTIISSCGKKFLDVNTNPNQPTQVGLNVILSAAEQGTANDMANDFPNVTRWDAYWSRSGNYVPDVQTEEYSIPNNYTDGEWTRIYLTLNAYNNMEKQAKVTPNGQFELGVAKLMKAFHFAILVDAYNDVPYSNAFDPLNSVHPTYDKGDAIYADLFKQIDSAIVYFDIAKNTVSAQDQSFDIIYGTLTDPNDQMDAWVRFANTVELKLLIHESQVSGQAGFISSQLAKIDANGRGYIGVGQGAVANPGYINSSNKISPFYGDFFTVTAPTTNQAYYRANTYAIDFYNSVNDPRVGYFYDPVSGSGGYAGNFDGDPASVPNSSTSEIGAGLLKGPSQGQLILSDFESLFLQAEAAQRGWISADPQTLYESAVTASFEYMYSDASGSVPASADTDAADYLSQGVANADWNASPDKLSLILTQKWAALNGINWFEAWTDFRRTGIPALPISASTNHVQPKIPIRFLYPQVELNTNGANVPQLGADAQFSAKIWWNQ